MLNHCRCKHKAGFEGRPAKDVQVASEAKADATQSDLRVLMKKKSTLIYDEAKQRHSEQIDCV